MSFVAKLPAPETIPPADSAGRSQWQRGRELFETVGCDFCLHDLTDPESAISGYHLTPEVPLPKDYPLPSEWKTPPLWGVAQTAPYMHDGSAPTLDDAIKAHGGQARHVRKAFDQLAKDDRKAVFTFLESLRAVEEN